MTESTRMTCGATTTTTAIPTAHDMAKAIAALKEMWAVPAYVEVTRAQYDELVRQAVINTDRTPSFFDLPIRIKE